jgi:hypothetical protein
MANNWSQKLRVLQRDKGVRVVVVDGRVGAGSEVVYRPRRPTDPKPWILRGFADIESPSSSRLNTYRYNGRNCRPVYPERENNE